jgi:hypothetical protein
VIGNDLVKLLFDAFVIGWQLTESSQRVCCLFDVPRFHEVAGSFREIEETSSENDSPQGLDDDWNAVAAGVLPVVSGVVHDGCEKETKGECELVAVTG